MTFNSEYYWAALKQYTREKSTFWLLEFEQTIWDAMDSVEDDTMICRLQ